MAASAAEPAAPRLDALYPLGGSPGSTIAAVVRGSDLSGAYALWFEDDGLTAEVIGVEPEANASGGSKRKKQTDLLRVEVKLAEAVAPGQRSFRALTPGGVSNPLKLFVHQAPATLEAESAHDLPRQAQPIPALPAVVHGRIDEVGQVDYYAFEAGAGEELLFWTVSSEALDPAVAIYDLTGSWFDPDRATRLAFADEPVAYPDLTTEARLRYRFESAGRYLVRVNGFWGHGGPDQSYALRIGPADADEAPTTPSDWAERTWTRSLETDRMERLWGRAVPSLAPSIASIPVIDADAEPTTFPVEPQTISMPSLIVGTVEHPGDIDRVRFAVEEGDALAFEVETPEKTIPELNPFLRVVDSDGVEALTNIHSRVNANGNISKQIEAKTQYSFPRKGEFTLEIRDITASYGDRKMLYRVLVRPQVPHVGEVHIDEDRLNLVAGVAQKLTVVTDQEEGYDGYTLLTLEGLPPGVQAMMATETEPDRPPAFNEGKKERFTTKSQKATFVLVSDASAPKTRTPVKARVYAQPVVEGQLGPKILAKELLVMVVEGGAEPAPPEATDEER